LSDPARRAAPALWVFVFVVVGLVAAGSWWLLADPLGPDEASTGGPVAQEGFYALGERTEGLEVGQVAPELVGDPGSGAVVTNLQGEPITLASLRGRPVWIVFWATWCPPCQAETPDLERTFEDHAADGLELIAIDVQEPVEVVRDHMEAYDLSYTAALDPSGAIMRAYGVFGLPTHYFIDRDGVIRERVYGPMTREQMEERVASILGD